jgi:hypothetical protein
MEHLNSAGAKHMGYILLDCKNAPEEGYNAIESCHCHVHVGKMPISSNSPDDE